MKPRVAILCGGLGTRLSEETVIKPKPMVEICGKPILWHIMKIYSSYGFDDFVIALGYKGELIKNYFLNYYLINSDLKVDLSSGAVEAVNKDNNKWNVELVDTGTDTLTGGRIKRLQNIMGNSTFLLTYGDGVSNVNIKELLDFHKQHGKIATVTAVRPAGRFGAIHFEDDIITSFSEKPQSGEGWINGGFFVFEPEIFDYFPEGDMEILERYPLETLVKEKQLAVYRHTGFWQCMDTLRDKNTLEEYWNSGKCPWKVWDYAEVY